jgi:hypothetical protein
MSATYGQKLHVTSADRRTKALFALAPRGAPLARRGSLAGAACCTAPRRLDMASSVAD